MKKELELIVDEPVNGHFYWTIVWRGQAGELPRVIDYARGPLPSRMSAVAMGESALRLQQLLDADNDSLAHTRMMPSMHGEWVTETVPAQLM